MIIMKNKEQQKYFNHFIGKYFSDTISYPELKRYNEMLINKDGFKSMRDIASVIKENENKTVQKSTRQN